MQDSFQPDEVERLLQSGDPQGAASAGWFGDEWSYRLVRSAAGGTLTRLEVIVHPYDTSTELGLDLSNDDGVASICSVSDNGALAGRLRRGDVVHGDVGRAVAQERGGGDSSQL